MELSSRIWDFFICVDLCIIHISFQSMLSVVVSLSILHIRAMLGAGRCQNVQRDVLDF